MYKTDNEDLIIENEEEDQTDEVQKKLDFDVVNNTDIAIDIQEYNPEERITVYRQSYINNQKQ